MPFINLDHSLATEIVEETSPIILKNLLYDGKINHREFEILLVVANLSKLLGYENELVDKFKSDLKKLCEQYIPDDSERSFERLVKFAKTKHNVSWVLFSRTCQKIPWEERDPLEGYLPRKNPIKKVFMTELVQFS